MGLNVDGLEDQDERRPGAEKNSDRALPFVLARLTSFSRAARTPLLLLRESGLEAVSSVASKAIQTPNRCTTPRHQIDDELIPNTGLLKSRTASASCTPLSAARS